MERLILLMPNYPKVFVKELARTTGLQCPTLLPTRLEYGHCYANDTLLNIEACSTGTLFLVIAVSRSSFHAAVIKRIGVPATEG